MILVVFIFVLVATLGLLLIYSRAYLPEWLGPGGGIIENLIPGIATTIVEVAVIVLLVSYVADRKWLPMRSYIMQTLAADYHYFAGFVHEATKIARSTDAQHLTQAMSGIWQDIHRHSTENAAQQKIQFLTPAFNPELAQIVSDYMHSRAQIEHGLRSICEPDGARHFGLWLSGTHLLPPTTQNIAFGAYLSAQTIIAMQEHLGFYAEMWGRESDLVLQRTCAVLEASAREARRYRRGFGDNTSQ